MLLRFILDSPSKNYYGCSGQRVVTFIVALSTNINELSKVCQMPYFLDQYSLHILD